MVHSVYSLHTHARVFLCCQVWLSVDGGNFFSKIHKFASRPNRPPMFTAGYRYESGIWAILTRDATPTLCIGKTG